MSSKKEETKRVETLGVEQAPNVEQAKVEQDIFAKDSIDTLYKTSDGMYFRERSDAKSCYKS